ncbi:MAG: hypothetical protein R3C70_09880 [Geminicoccaceae bacterium]
MRMMLLAFATAIGIAFLADFGLHHAGFSSADRQSSNAVRIGEASEGIRSFQSIP